MSSNRHLSPGVDTTLLKTHFSVVTDAVGVMRFLEKYNKFHPTVNLVLSFSFFFWFHFEYYFSICNFSVFRDLIFENEEDYICHFCPSDTLR